MHSLPIQTEYGVFIARYSEKGLAELRFPEENSASALAEAEASFEWHALTTAAVHDILGNKACRAMPPVDLSQHTEFRRRVWTVLQQIPLGETLTYGEVATELGQPSASRAVGGACRANPIPLLIPCHRVLGYGNTLGGFSGGLPWKRRLLAIEGAQVKEEQLAPKRQLAFAHFSGIL